VKSIALLCVLAATAHADDSDDYDAPPAYKLNLEADIPALAITTFTTTAWFFDLGPAWCAPRCDPTTLNALDRPFAGRYVPAWTTAGTTTATVLLVAPLPILLAVERPKNAINDTVVIAESVMFSSALGVMFETGVRRPRPFLYSDKAPLSVRTDTNGSLSFFSGHTADSFAATIALWRTLDRLELRPRWKYLILGAGLAGSAFVGISRVASGDHFPTDVIVGADIGIGFGFLLPALHSRGVAVSPTYVGGDSPGVSFAGAF
jgi:membrane-associated phospholipid phosphatase